MYKPAVHLQLTAGQSKPYSMLQKKKQEMAV